MAEIDTGSVTFGDYELDMKSRRLRRLGEPVSLQPRVLELLGFLIRHRKRAVNKDEIQDAVWNGTIVSETALTRAIMKARRAVGDSAEDQRVIRTVHGHGYQFVAEITVDTPSRRPAEEAAPEASIAATDPSPGPVTTGRRWLPVAATLMALLMTLGVFWLTRSLPPADGPKIAVLPFHNATDTDELDWVRLGLLGFATDLIRSSTELGVVPASDLIRLAENQPTLKASPDDIQLSHLRQLKRAFGATHFVAGSIQPAVGGLRLTYTLFDQTGQISQSTMVHEQSTELVRGMVREVNRTLTRARYLSSDVSASDPFISEAYARGVSYALKGQCADATALFQVVVDRNPDNLNARFEQAVCARILGHPAEAEHGFQSILETIEKVAQSPLRPRVLRNLGTLYHITGRLEEAEAFLDRGLTEARQAGDHDTVGRLLNAQALLAKDRQDKDTARALLGQASLAYRHAGREILPGQIHSALANLSMADGNWSDAENHLNDALASFRALGDRRNEAMMINNFGYLRRRQGRMEDAERLHRESMAIRQEIGDQVGQARIMTMLSIIYRGQGRLSEARDIALEAIDITTQAQDTLFMATSYAQLGFAEEALGQLEASRAAFEESKHLFADIEDVLRHSQVELRLAQLDLTEEQPARAKSRIASVRKIAAEHELHELMIEALEKSGDVSKHELNLEEARRAYADALDYVSQHNFKQRQSSLWVKLGRVYLETDQPELAEPLLGLLLADENTTASLKFHAEYVFYQGDPSQAAELLRQAKTSDEANWSDEDERRLENYLAAANATR